MLALIGIILAGFIMMTLGAALLLIGETPLLSGKRIPATRARLIGAVLFAFLPLAFIVRQASNALFGSDAVEGPVLMWSVFGFCWLIVFALLFRVMFPRGPTRDAKASASTPAKQNPFGAAEPMGQPTEEVLPWIEPEPEPAKKTTPVKKPPREKTRRPAASDKDPFDFS